MKIKIQRQDFTFRIIKVGKTAVSIAVCGLLASFSGGAVAESLLVNSDNTSITKILSVDSLDLYHKVVDSAESSYTDSLSLRLDPGVNITGEIVTGGIPAAIFTSDVRDGGSVDKLSFATAPTTLTLGGDNRINGVVGLHLNLDSNTGGDFYGSYTPDPLSLINVNGSVTFNSQVYANRIEINQGGTLQFYGDVDGTSTTTIDYNGHGSTVTLHPVLNPTNDLLGEITIDGSIVKDAGTTNGSLIFTGAAHITGDVGTKNAPGSQSAIGLVDVRGAGSLVQIDGDLSADHLQYTAQSVVAVDGDLLLNVKTATGAVNSVSMNDTDSTLQVGGDIVGVAAKAAVTTTQNGTGTVTMLGGTQTVTGDLGQSGLSLRQLNVGGEFQTGTAVGLDGDDNIASNTTITGNVYATNVKLNNASSTDSSLTMASGFSITGAVVTEDNERGTLTMAGGTQSVTGTVGAANPGGNWLGTVKSGADAATTTFTGDVFAQNVTNTGTGTSNFATNVTGTNINVNSGVSNFTDDVTATTTTIGTGVGNFNTNGTGATASAIVFSANRTQTATPSILGSATANLYTGLTGNIDFASKDAVVNVWDGQSITGAVTSSGATAKDNTNGILNFKGAGTITSNIGSTVDTGISQLNVNTEGTSTKTVAAEGDIYAEAINLKNDAVLTLAAGKKIVGTTATALTGAQQTITTDVANTGTLTLVGGGHTVTGVVGANAMALGTVNAGATAGTDTFNNTVYAQNLNFTGNNSTVVLNGQAGLMADGSAGTSANSTNSGLIGTVDFNTNDSTLKIGDSVNLTTGVGGIQMANANNAVMTFVGSSTVTGVVGGDTEGRSTLHTINAGANGSIVTFVNDVYVAAETLHVSGTGVVNLQGDLYGPLRYDADGSVNVGDGKEIKTIEGTVRTLNDETGTLNFVGGTTTNASIGETSKRLLSVGFHNDTTDSTNLPLVVGPVTVNIGHSVFAVDTFIGNDGVGATTANITATGKHLGTNLTLSDNTTLNTAGAVSSSEVTPVDFEHSKFANGTIAPTATVTQSTVGTGVIQTNDATLNFAVGTTAWAADNDGTGGFVNDATSSKITGTSGSTLLMGVAGTVNLSLLGSLHDGQTATLIDVASGPTASTVLGTYQDNSFVIDTQLSRVAGDLVMTATRDADTYVDKSDTMGHFSNNAAVRLGTLAAAGTDYGQDMQTVLNKLDIDQWGYGNNEANLATQVKRLAPVANNSVGKSALALGAMAADSIGLRMHELRNVPQKSSYESVSVWFMNNYQRGTQTAVGNYDGYTNKLTGMSVGVDTRPNNSSVVGAAFSYGTGTVDQTQFRAGDQANLKSTQLSLYGAYDLTPELFLGGSASVANQNTQGNRATAVGRTALFDFDGTQSGYKVDLGYRINFSNSTTALTPMLTVEGRTLKQDSYTETNAGDIGLNVASQRLQSKQLGLGLRLNTTQYVGGMVVKPDLTVSTARERGQDASSIASSFMGDNTSDASFNTDLAANSPRTTKVSLGVGVLMSKTSSLMARYQFVKRDTFTANRAELTVRWDF